MRGTDEERGRRRRDETSRTGIARWLGCSHAACARRAPAAAAVLAVGWVGVVAGTGSAHGSVVDFEFQAAGGATSYRSTDLNRSVAGSENPASGPAVVLVETPALEDARYKRQMDALYSLDAEALYLFYVTACPDDVEPSGHSTTRDTARTLGGGVKRFRVRVLDGQGTVLKESAGVLAAADVRAAVRPGPGVAAAAPARPAAKPVARGRVAPAKVRVAGRSQQASR